MLCLACLMVSIDGKLNKTVYLTMKLQCILHKHASMFYANTQECASTFVCKTDKARVGLDLDMGQTGYFFIFLFESLSAAKRVCIHFSFGVESVA